VAANLTEPAPNAERLWPALPCLCCVVSRELLKRKWHACAACSHHWRTVCAAADLHLLAVTESASCHSPRRASRLPLCKAFHHMASNAARRTGGKQSATKEFSRGARACRPPAVTRAAVPQGASMPLLCCIRRTKLCNAGVQLGVRTCATTGAASASSAWAPTYERLFLVGWCIARLLHDMHDVCFIALSPGSCCTSHARYFHTNVHVQTKGKQHTVRLVWVHSDTDIACCRCYCCT